MNWDDARAYVAWLSQRTGQRYRLLTEPEWEYAARAGTTTAYSTGASITTAQAKFDNTLGRTQPVGSYAANPFGLFDMHGNVWEQVEDCNASYCSSRGGSWLGPPGVVRSTSRSWGAAPTNRGADSGFRLARTL